MDEDLALSEHDLASSSRGERFLFLLIACTVHDGGSGSLKALGESAESLDEGNVEDLEARTAAKESAQARTNSCRSDVLIDLCLDLVLVATFSLDTLFERLGPDE